MRRARAERVRFGEVGGWAISPLRRSGWEALRILLATFGLLELLGGCIGFATATTRHGSAQILKKIGLRCLDENGIQFGHYYDPHYACQMEMLAFDSRSANQRFVPWIKEFSSNLVTAAVLGTADQEEAEKNLWSAVPDSMGWNSVAVNAATV